MIGGGLAGLSAAVELAANGRRVEVLEGAAQPGGRCRSYFDPQLDTVIDNGNHLVLSGNSAVMAYLARIGAQDRLAGPAHASIDFADLNTDERWTLRPNDGPLPWWMFSAARRTPGTTASDYLGLAPLLYPARGRRIDQLIACKGPFWERLMQPFLLAVLNTAPQEGDASLAAAVIRETLGRGGLACRPRIAHPTLAAAFIEPAVAWLEARGNPVRCGRRARGLRREDGRVTAIAVPGGDITVGTEDLVILAVPPWAAQDLVPGLEAPDDFRAIVNGHFRIAPPPGAPLMLSLIGGTAEWVFAFPDRISVTVSGADRLLDADREALAKRLWRDVTRVYGMGDDLPPWQIVKERRATFAATPAQNAKRPGARTAWSNLFLAGDWTDTGLPATIEGALRSGRTAAEAALGCKAG